MSRVGKVEREIRQALKDTGLVWRIEIGGSHRKIFLEGMMIAVFSHNEGSEHGGGSASKNIFAKIRNAAKRHCQC